MVSARIKIAAWAVLWILAGGVGLANADEPMAAEPRTVRVLDNIYTIVHGNGIDSNTTFLVTDEGAIVIDTRVTPGEARKVLDEIRKHTDKPVKYAINTHFHGDHTFGNQVFRESAAIIAHKNARSALSGSNGLDHLNFFKTFNIPGLDEVKVTPPNLVYEDRMELYLGPFHLQLIHLGRGHTDGDTAIYIKELRTIIAGDLVFNKKIPYVSSGYIDEWIDSLSKLEDLDAEIIVPGHGDVGDKPILIRMKHYLIELRNYVTAELAKGSSLQQTRDAVRPVLREKYRDWLNLDWIDANIERAYLEFSVKKKT
ncbi:MAG: MBL fold metallo-hydrolase [Nitrospinae bacterium]|nr:MBL fold metallo-hydrolase [Nitrospinota bacterium]